MHRSLVVSLLAAAMPFALAAQQADDLDRAARSGRAALEDQSGGRADGHELRTRRARPGAGNLTHVRYDQFYRGVRVFEGEAIAHVDSAGAVNLTRHTRDQINVDTTPSISQADAQAIALRALHVRGGADVSGALEILPQGERSAADRLVWHVKLFYENDQDGVGQFDVFVDAKSGQVAWWFNSLETSAATATGNTMYAGTVGLPADLTSGVYSLKNPLEANLQTNDLLNRTSGKGTIFSNSTGSFGNGKRDTSDRATAGADAHFGMTQTWQYFATAFGRNGINNAGKSSYGRVHYSNRYENAFWSDSCFCMTYGDGASTFLPLVSLDVTGHEMAHGVMSSEANLTYSGESGGLNESSSDIFGTMVEYFTNNSSDVPDYWIGERIYKSNWSTGSYQQNKALRYMDNPAKDGASPACWSSTLKNLDVHYSSGPNNHMFYLLAEGGTSKCNGKTVSGIGRAAAARIWYEAIANYMTSSTNYAGARTACLKAAAALYGSGSVQYNAVAAAYSAINVN